MKFVHFFVLAAALATSTALVSAPAVMWIARRAQAKFDHHKVPLLGIMGAFVFAAQMINFTIPTTLKAWFDWVGRPGRTFSYASGKPEGLAKGKKVIIFKYKAKARYRRKTGHRQKYSRIVVRDIVTA